MPTAAEIKQTKKASETLQRERAARVIACEQAIMLVLKRHKCKLMTIQTFVDGNAEPIVIRVAALE